MVAIKFTATGLQEVMNDLGLMSSRARDMTPFMEGFVVPTLIRSAHETFETQGRPVPWKALAPSTVERRRNQDIGSIKILRDTGLLIQSIGSEGPTGVNEVRTHGVTVGTALEYGIAHQEGTKHIPARPFLLWQEQDIEDVRTGIADFVIYGSPDAN